MHKPKEIPRASSYFRRPRRFKLAWLRKWRDRWQEAIELGLQRDLLKRLEREKDAARRDKEAKEEQAMTDRFLVRLANEWPAKWAAAKALAVSRGHERPTQADFRDSLRIGPARPVE